MNKPEMIAALRKIIDSEGVDIIADKKRFSAYFSDFLPGYRYKNERRALLTAADADDWGKLLELHDKGQNDHTRAVRILLPQLMDDIGWTMERSVLILECYVTAMGWNDVDVGSIAAGKNPPPAPQSAPKPTPPPPPNPQNPTDPEAQYQLGKHCYDMKNYADAVKWYRKAAEQGHAEAQYWLGRCYFDGRGITRDRAEAIKWWRKAAEQGHAGAQYWLGLCYEKGQGVSKDFAEAAKWYRKAAEQGNVYAQFNLGRCYEKGQGVSKDLAEAAKWYRKAAEQGHAEAQYNLGFCYEFGKGVTQDYTEAVKWYRKAAEQGHSEAKRCVNALLRANPNLSTPPPPNPQNPTDPEAQYQLGKHCYDMKNYADAVKWLRKAADQMHAEAQCRLGQCYENGTGTIIDRKEAAEWYRKAAMQDHAEAQFRLGSCYHWGKGITQHYIEAAKWYRKAAEQGQVEAQYCIGNFYYSGQGVLTNYAEAVKWYRKAAEQGNANAQYRLGYCCEKGEGVAKDHLEAIKWYRKAAEQGHAMAGTHLEAMTAANPNAGTGTPGRASGKTAPAPQNPPQQNPDTQNPTDALTQFQRGVHCHKAKDYIGAVKWYRKAADQGLGIARISLDNLLRTYPNLSTAGKASGGSTTAALSVPAQLTGDEWRIVQVMMLTAPSRNDLYSSIIRQFGNSRGAVIYAAVKNLFNPNGGNTTAQQSPPQQNSPQQSPAAAEAQYQQGMRCYGEENFPEAAQWFHKAAEQGNANAQCRLGNCYYWGEGVTQDYYKAAEWYRKAAEQGHVSAQNNLGFCYKNGNGVTKDEYEAALWFRKAADQGDEYGRKALRDLNFN
jgi:TPR repeat protein